MFRKFATGLKEPKFRILEYFFVSGDFWEFARDFSRTTRVEKLQIFRKEFLRSFKTKNYKNANDKHFTFSSGSQNESEFESWN